MDLTLYYFIFTPLFLGGAAGYWLSTQVLKDPKAIYEGSGVH